MKKLFLSIVLLSSALAYSQTSIPLKFQVVEDADIKFGKEWDFSTTELKTAINVTFDGKTLKMIYTTGKVYFETSVISFNKIITQRYNKPVGDVYTLKIDRDGLIQYILIEFKYPEIPSDNKYTLKVPYMDKTGEVFSYHYFQCF